MQGCRSLLLVMTGINARFLYALVGRTMCGEGYREKETTEKAK